MSKRSYKILLFALGGISISAIVVILIIFNLSSPNLVSFNGRVIDEVKNPIANTELQINDTIVVRTDPDGNFSVNSLRPGKYQIFLEESLVYQPLGLELNLRRSPWRKVVLERKIWNLPVSENTTIDEDLIAAAELWSRDRQILYHQMIQLNHLVIFLLCLSFIYPLSNLLH